MGKKRLSDRATQIVRDRLGWAVDDLHDIARKWQGEADGPGPQSYRDAADEISKIRKDYR